MNRQSLLDDTKAGLSGIDITKVNSIINTETYGSAKYNRMLGKQVSYEQRAKEYNNQFLATSKAQITAAEEIVDELVQQRADSVRDYRRIIAVVDFDCFYAAVEIRDNPRLSGKPVMVSGGGIVCASNYEARHFGVRSAMPSKLAKKLCPTIISIDSNMSKYAAVSRQAGAAFERYDACYTMLGMDECRLDITSKTLSLLDEWYEKGIHIEDRDGLKRLTLPNDIVGCTKFISDKLLDDGIAPCAKADHTINDSLTVDRYASFMNSFANLEKAAAYVVFNLRTDIQKTIRLTCSCGVGINRQVAKICADLNKPNGQTIAPLTFCNMDSLRRVLGDLPIRKIFGIGAATAEILSRKPFECKTIGDIYTNRGRIFTLMTEKSALSLIFAATGLQNLDESEFNMSHDSERAKSVGNEMTFGETIDFGFIKDKLKCLCRSVSERLARKGRTPSRVSVKVRFADWTDKIHVIDLERPSSDLDVLYYSAVSAASYLLTLKRKEVTSSKCPSYVFVGLGKGRREVESYQVRLVGVSAHTFIDDDDHYRPDVLAQLTVNIENNVLLRNEPSSEGDSEGGGHENEYCIDSLLARGQPQMPAIHPGTVIDITQSPISLGSSVAVDPNSGDCSVVSIEDSAGGKGPSRQNTEFTKERSRQGPRTKKDGAQNLQKKRPSAYGSLDKILRVQKK